MPNPRGVMAGAVIVGGAYAAWLLSDWGGPSVIRVIDDVGLIAFALFASVCSTLAARRACGREHYAWVAMAIGTGGWATGEALWSYYDLVADVTPLPSWADAGYVLFLLGAGLWLTLLLSGYSPGAQLRLLLDGVIVCAAIFGATWVTLLDTVYAARASDGLTLAAALAYPVVDIALITIALLILVRAPASKRPMLALVVAGLVLIAISDMAFAYLTALDAYDQHHAIAIGWAWGFLCIGIAALTSDRRAGDRAQSETQVPSRISAWLPYVPVAISALICTPGLIGSMGPVAVAAAVTVYAVIARQLLVILDNRRLLVEVADHALRDPLTGLANRALFADRLAHAMELHQRHSVAVLLINLDHFKVVNENLGHPAGDAMLVRVAERLVGTARSSDTVARLGGDEFAILMEGDVDASRTVAQRMVAAFERPFLIFGESLRVRPSVGLSVAGADDADITVDELLRQADVAMHSAKRSRFTEVNTYSEEMDFVRAEGVLPGTRDAEELGSARLLGELRHAIEHFGLSLVYQPKFDLRTYEVVGLEALIRWPHPRRGLLSPHQFLPLVRQHGLMRSMTDMVIELALDDTANWYGKGVEVPVAINVFAPAISDPELPGRISRALDDRGLPPSALTVEITEDLLLDNLGQTRQVFNKLRDKGIRVAIDDFGSGYSALWYLREFPVDEVKLDKEFIAPVLTHPASAAIVRAVIDLAHALNVTPVAEGVENAETATRLLEYGCVVAQGFHYSPPLTPTAVLALLESQRRSAGYEVDGTRRSEIELMQ